MSLVLHTEILLSQAFQEIKPFEESDTLRHKFVIMLMSSRMKLMTSIFYYYLTSPEKNTLVTYRMRGWKIISFVRQEMLCPRVVVLN